MCLMTCYYCCQALALALFAHAPAEHADRHNRAPPRGQDDSCSRYSFCVWFLHGSGHSDGHGLAALTLMLSTVRLMSVSLHAG